jgi:hypothetical protein
VADAIGEIAQATSRLGRAEREWFAAIHAAHAEGWSIRAIARAAGVSEADVREIVKRPTHVGRSARDEG